MAYTSFRMIAYHVPTAYGLPAGGECKISDESKELIKDYLPDMGSDAALRLKRIISIAEEMLEDNFAPAGTLTIFIVPEFYFRPQAETSMGTEKVRCYTDKEMFAVLGALRSVFATDKRWKDWLFILGSIVWRASAVAFLIDAATLLTAEAKALAEDNEKDAKAKADQSNELNKAAQSGDATDKFIVFNTGIVVIGGFGMTVFDKFHYSDFDQIGKSFRAWNVDDAYPYVLRKWRAPLKEYFMDRRKLSTPATIIPVGNLWFGVEICLDHELGVLEKYYAKHQDQPELHFQVLTCCGMGIKPSNVVCKNGFVLRMDGSPLVPADDPHSEIQRVTNVKDGKVTATATRETAKNLWRSDNQRAVTLALTGNRLLDLSGVSIEFPDGTKNLKDLWKQEVVVYKNVRFPALNLWKD